MRHLPPFFEHRFRIVYSKIELCQHYREIQHPAVRETLRFFDFDHGLEIHHDGDLPARSGMGSSSSFTVGLLHACYAFKGLMIGKNKLAHESIHIEQNMIGETVGSQDQVAAAYGGINHILFKVSGAIEVRPLILPRQRVEELNDHLMLFYTGIRRTASDVAASYVTKLNSKEKLLCRMYDMVEKGIDILQGNGCIADFGALLHETWLAKRSLSTKVANGFVDSLYQRALNGGALGGKITGAGGGGFLMLFVPPDKQASVRNALTELLHVPFRFDFNGSQIIVYEPRLDQYSHADEQDRKQRALGSFSELESLVK